MTKRFLLCTKQLNSDLRSILGYPSILVQHMLFEHILQVILEQDYCVLQYGFIPDGLELIEENYTFGKDLSAQQVQQLSCDFQLIKDALHFAIYQTIGKEINIINYDLICSNLLMITSDD